MPAYKINHITRYTYASPVIDCTNQIMLYPIIDDRLEVKNHDVKVSNDPEIEVFTDYFGNKVGAFSVIKPHTELLIESTAEVFTKPVLVPMDEMPAEDQWKHLQDIKYEVEFFDFLKNTPFACYEDIKGTLSSIINAADKPLKTALVLSEYVYDNFTYQKGVTNIETPIEDIWNLKAGVCQDFAHILLVMIRIFKIPARYVSGYVCPKETGVRGEGATHAWVEAYIPFYGWLGLDPTNNCIVTDGHVRIAIGRQFADCTPVKGTYKGSGEHTLEVTVHIENGKPRQMPEQSERPAFIYTLQNKEVPVNSYRKYLEMQQQQQQQQ
ncbi:MAG: transglutaminase family protein [Segetibacter sp.]